MKIAVRIFCVEQSGFQVLEVISIEFFLQNKFCDGKCHFQDVAIRTFQRKNTLARHLGNSTFDHQNSIPKKIVT